MIVATTGSDLSIDYQTAHADTLARREPGRGVRLFISWAVALAGALCLSVPSGYSYGPALLFLVGLPLLAIKRPAVPWREEDKWLLLALLYTFFTVVLLNVIHAQPLSDYEQASRYILAMLVLTLALAYPPRAMFWWSGLVFGAIAGGGLAIWQVASGSHVRAEGFMIAVQFGNLSLLLGFLCLAGIGWALGQPRAPLWVSALVLAAVLGLVGSLLSGTRGGWLALPVGLTIIYLGYRTQMRRRYLASGIAAAVAIMAVLYLVPHTGVQERIHMAGEEVENYFETQQAYSSVGIRFEMWRTSLLLTHEYPLFGWGEREYLEPMQALIADEELASGIARFTHVHNDILDSLLKQGVVGLSGLLVIYLVPLWLFMRQLSPARGGHRREVRAFALSGILLVTCLMTFGLSQAFFSHNSGVTVYLFFLVVIWCLLRRAQRQPGESSGGP